MKLGTGTYIKIYLSNLILVCIDPVLKLYFIKLPKNGSSYIIIYEFQKGLQILFETILSMMNVIKIRRKITLNLCTDFCSGLVFAVRDTYSQCMNIRVN
jgi:hypothetical protein